MQLSPLVAALSMMAGMGYDFRVKLLPQRLHGLQDLRSLLSGPLQKKFIDPLSRAVLSCVVAIGHMEIFIVTLLKIK